MVKTRTMASPVTSVVVDFDIDASTVFIVIKNLGTSAAIDLRIKPSAPILGLEGKKDLRKLNLFKEIKYLAPLKEIRIFVDSYNSFFHNLKNTQITFALTYKDNNKKSYKEKIIHDLKIYTDFIFFIKKF